jgi:hypothetical protein
MHRQSWMQNLHNCERLYQRLQSYMQEVLVNPSVAVGKRSQSVPPAEITRLVIKEAGRSWISTDSENFRSALWQLRSLKRHSGLGDGSGESWWLPAFPQAKELVVCRLQDCLRGLMVVAMDAAIVGLFFEHPIAG